MFSHAIVMVIGVSSNLKITGEDPGFLERGFICIKVWGLRFPDFILFLLIIP